MKKQKGFSLLEMMISLSVFLIVMSAVYSIMIYYSQFTQTKHSSMRMQQESRYILSTFASEIKDAGAVLTLADTGAFLQSPAYFTGILPLNSESNNFGDGIILASGDPEAVTKLKEPYTGGGTQLTVESTEVKGYDPDHPYLTPEWGEGNVGIIISTDGFYVFSVESVSNNVITLRDTPVYYSGQLSCPNHTDTPKTSSVTGDAITYAVRSPVIRLTNFAIYLFNQKMDGTVPLRARQWVRISDTFGATDVLSDTSASNNTVITENLWDMQISYSTFDKETFLQTDPTSSVDSSRRDYYTAGGSDVRNNLLTDMSSKLLKEVTVSAVLMTDEFVGQGKVTPAIPALGDQAAYTMPSGKYAVKVITFSVETRNFAVTL